MNPVQLLQWQHQGYPRYHQNRANLVLHIVLVPLFIAGNVLLLMGLARGSWLWSSVAILATVFSLVLQGRGHRMEHVPVEPFTGPGQAVARVFFEQWITFPRFVLSGGWWRVLRRRRAPKISAVEVEEHVAISDYALKFEAALDRTERLGLGATPVRLVVRKDCVDMAKVMPALLDYFDRHRPEELIGQTAAIHFALVPLLVRETGIPFQLTIGWMVHDGRTIFQHDEETYRRFLREKLAAWSSEGMPFHLWLTSPAYEIIDVTFAMNLGWAKTREQCEKLVIYQSAHSSPGKDIYHPMLVGPEFFNQSGATMSMDR